MLKCGSLSRYHSLRRWFFKAACLFSAIATNVAQAAPVITSQPAPTSIAPGENAVLEVSATGDAPSYQWFSGSIGDTAFPVSEATGPLFVSPALRADTSFWVRVTDSTGSIDSQSAAITMAQLSPFRLKTTGENSYGQLGDGTVVNRSVPNVVTGSVISASTGSTHSLYVTSDGTLWVTGGNYGGQLGNGTTVSVTRPVPVATNVKSVAAGGNHSLFIKTDNSLWAMGANDQGQLGDGTTTPRLTPVQVTQNVISVSAGVAHSLFVKSDGSLWTMGYNYFGQLGDGTTSKSLTPVQVAQDVVSVSATQSQSMFIKSDGTLWGMGNNTDGQLGIRTQTEQKIPVQVTSGVSKVATGENFNLYIRTDGSLWVTGIYGYYQFGVGPSYPHSAPPRIQVATNVVKIAAGDYYSLFVKNDKTLWATGDNANGNFGNGTTSDNFSPIQVGQGVTFIDAKSHHVLIGDAVPYIMEQPADSELLAGGVANLSAAASGAGPLTYQWYVGDSGDTGSPIPGATSSGYQTPPVSGSGKYWVRVSNAYGSHDSRTVLVTMVTHPVITSQPAAAAPAPGDSATFSVSATNGTLTHQWFRGLSGDISNPVSGATGPLLVTLPVQSNTNFWVRVTNMAGFTDSETAAATLGSPVPARLLATGYNNYGQLADGTNANSLTPVLIASRVIRSATGYDNSFYIRENGDLWASGYNNYGQLADSSTVTRFGPVLVATQATQITAGEYHSLFVKSDGTLWAMGYNGTGQLGDGTTTTRTSAVPVTGSVIQVSAGGRHSLFVKSDGSLWAMGDNTYGQLGNGGTTVSTSPVHIADSVAMAVAGDEHSLFLKTDGTVWAAGKNSSGQLGNGTTALTNPVPIQVASGVANIVAGRDSSFLIKSDGTLWAVGDNNSGKLGTGNTDTLTTFSRVATDVKSATSGDSHTLFVKTDDTFWAMGNNSYGQLGNGTNKNSLTPVQVASSVASGSAGDYHSLIRDLLPAIDTHPADTGIVTASSAMLSIFASGSAPLSYQWYKGGAGDTGIPIPSATSATYQTPSLVNDTSYWVRVTSPYGSIDSRTAAVRIVTTPAITGTQAAPVSAGENASISISASGGGLVYQWFQGSSGDTSIPIPGATGPLLVTSSLATSANFWVRITNAAGSLDSATVPVNVTSPIPGYLRSIGSTENGQLGNGMMTSVSRPVPIATDVSKVSCASGFSLILKTNGSLWVMRASSTTPVQITTAVTWITAGTYLSTFVKSDGTLWTLNAASTNTPTQVSTGVSMAWPTYSTLYILKTNGTLVSKSAFSPSSPEYIMATQVVGASASDSHFIFIKNDGTLWGSGTNYAGELGVNRYNTGLPVQLSSNVVKATAGFQTTYFVKNDGTLWGMGNNADGQLGGNNAGGTPGSLIFSDLIALDTGVADVAASGYHLMYVKTDGSLWGLGRNSSGQLGDGTVATRTFPVLAARQVSQVSVGFENTLFVTTDGTLWGCGSNKSNQLGPLAATVTTTSQVADNVTATSAGASHSLILKADGTLWAFGSNNYGQLGDGTQINRAIPAFITGEVAKVSAGSTHSLFVKNDGTLWAMGNNSNGRLGDGTTTTRLTPVLVASGVSSAAAGNSHSLYVKNDGSLWAMGANGNGQLGNGTATGQSTPVQIAANVVTAAAGYYHSLYLKTDGSLWATGYNNDGQLGNGTTAQRHTPIQITTGVTRIAAGQSHSQFLKSDGSLWAMGSNGYGQLGDTTNASRPSPVQIATGVTSFSAGNNFSLFIKSDATLWATGYNASYQLGDGSTNSRTTPVQVGTATIGVSAGGSHSLRLTTVAGSSVTAIGSHPVSGTIAQNGTTTFAASATGSGTLTYQWYYGYSGDTSQPLNGSTSATFTTPATNASFQYWVRVSSASGTANSRTVRATLLNTPTITTQPALAGKLPGGGVRLTAAGSANTFSYQWYSSASGGDAQPVPGGTGPTLLTLPLKTATTFHLIVSNPSGSSQSQQVTVSPSPVAGRYLKVAGATYGSSLTQKTGAVTSASTSSGHSLFVKTSGILWGMGSNSQGQLGDVPGVPASTPVRIADDVASASAGAIHSLFVKTDGTLWGMGGNGSGRLGDGTTTNRPTPVLVATGVTSASAGYDHSLFIKSDGTLWAMGFNNAGKLGDGTTISRSTPVQVATSVIMAAAGRDHSVFLKSDRTLWGMGNNTYNQLGQKNSSSARTPVKIADDVVSVAAGDYASFYISSNGTLWTTGRNQYGQLGYGATDANWITSSFGQIPFYFGPARIAAADVSTVASGTSHSLWTKPDGALWGTGFDSHGQLCATPPTGVMIPPAKKQDRVWGAAAGGNNSAILTTNSALEPPVILAHPVSIFVSTGGTATFSVTAAGPSLTYQWYNGATGDTAQPISGATEPSYTTAALALDTQVWVKVSNTAAYSESRTATASIGGPPATYQDWVESQGLGGEDGFPSADPDGDSRSNLLEYATGTSANQFDSSPLVGVIVDPISSKTDFHVRLRRGANLRYTCQVTTDLLTWWNVPLEFKNGQWTINDYLLDVGSATAADDNLWDLTLEPLVSDERLFLKINVEMTEP